MCEPVSVCLCEWVCQYFFSFFRTLTNTTASGSVPVHLIQMRLPTAVQPTRRPTTTRDECRTPCARLPVADPSSTRDYLPGRPVAVSACTSVYLPGCRAPRAVFIDQIAGTSMHSFRPELGDSSLLDTVIGDPTSIKILFVTLPRRPTTLAGTKMHSFRPASRRTDYLGLGTRASWLDVRHAVVRNYTS